MKPTYRSTRRACYLGYITQAITNNLAPLFFLIFQEDYHLSFEMMGRLVLINFGSQILVDLIAVKFADRVGHRRMVVAAHLFCTLGLVALGVLPRLMPSPYAGLVIAVLLYAVGGGLIEVLISPIVDSLPGDAKASSMSLLHSFYCWGQMAVVLVTTLALRLLGHQIWFLLPILWAAVPLYNTFRFCRVPLAPPVPQEQQKSPRSLLKSRFFLIALLLMLAAGASELTMSQWSSLFAEKGLQVPKVLGDLLGPCLFAALMGLGRVLYSVFGQRIRLQNALLFSGMLCVACYLTTVFFPTPILSLLGCAVCGFSVSLMWPGTYSLSSALIPYGGTAMFGLLAMFGDIGASLGPWLAGLVSDLVQRMPGAISLGASMGLSPDQTGLKAGLLLGVIFPMLMVIGVLMLRGKRSAQPEPQP